MDDVSLLKSLEDKTDRGEGGRLLPDMDLSSMLTVFGLLLYLCIQFGLRPPGTGLGLY